MTPRPTPPENFSSWLDYIIVVCPPPNNSYEFAQDELKELRADLATSRQKYAKMYEEVMSLGRLAYIDNSDKDYPSSPDYIAESESAGVRWNNYIDSIVAKRNEEISYFFKQFFGDKAGENMKNILCKSSGTYSPQNNDTDLPATYTSTYEKIPNTPVIEDNLEDTCEQDTNNRLVTRHPIVDKPVKKSYLNRFDLIIVVYLAFTSSMFFLTKNNEFGSFLSAIIPFYLGCRIIHEREKSRTSS